METQKVRVKTHYFYYFFLNNHEVDTITGNGNHQTCVESQVFATSLSFIHTALVSRIFLDVFSCYNLKISQRSKCTIAHSVLWDIFILLMSYIL